MKKLFYALLSIMLCFGCLVVNVHAFDDDSFKKPIDNSDYAVLLLDQDIYPQLSFNGCTIYPTINVQGYYTLDGTNYTEVNATATLTSVSYSFSGGGTHITSCTMTSYHFYITNNHVVIYMFFDLWVDGLYKYAYVPYVLVY